MLIPAQRHVDMRADRIRIGKVIGRLAGSKTDMVSATLFAYQLGSLSMVLWYVLLIISGDRYLQENAYVLAIFLGIAAGFIFRWPLKSLVSGK